MQWTFDPVGGLWVAIALAVLLVATTWLIKPKGQAPLVRSRRLTLVGLRLLAAALLLFAWVRPTLITVTTEAVRSVLLVLVDSSRSMSVQDGLAGTTRWETALRQLQASDSSLSEIAKKNEVHAYHFDQTLQSVDVDEQGRIALPKTPDGDASAIGAALAELLDREAKAKLMGVVLLSDGAQRAVPPHDASPLIAARRLAAEGTPLYTFPIGDRTSKNRADLAVEDLVVSERAFAGAPLGVSALLRTSGFANRTAKVRLLWEKRDGEDLLVDTANIAIRQGVPNYPIELSHTPLEAGEWKLTLQATPLDGETLTDNNTISTFVTVREGGIRVVYLAGATRIGGVPGVEQRFVRASLAASPDMVVERPNEPFDYRRPRRNLVRWLTEHPADVVVLDDLDIDALDRASWAYLTKLVNEGTGLVMIGGRHSFGPGGHQATPLAEVLPIRMGRAERQAFGQPMREDVHLPGPMQMVPAGLLGERHPVMQLGPATGSVTRSAAWKQLPPLDGSNRLDRARLKPNALVLATAGSGANAQPLLIASPAGLGRVLAFGGDSTWRWVMAGKGDLHRRFWRQVVLWLAKQEDTSGSPVRLELASRRLSPGSQLDIAASVRLPLNEDGTSPTVDVRYHSTVRLPDGTEQPLSLTGDANRVTARFNLTHQAGDYTVRVEAFDADTSLGVAESRFLVPMKDLELDRPAADPSSLARLADLTSSVGGRSLAPEELPTLLEELAELEQQERQQITSRYTPWDRWPFFLLLVTVLSAEWTLRRHWGMP